MVQQVLCVAEKPSVAKSITSILSDNQFTTHNTNTNFIKNYQFNYPQTNSHFTVTAVAGHLNEYEFTDGKNKWNACEPFALFDAAVRADLTQSSRTIAQNLRQQARNMDMLIIWTDCDREGEHIGSEIAQICRGANRNIIVKRARFSAIIAQQIHRAAQNPVNLDQAQADAVEARMILDLRIGAAFTRLQTMSLQTKVAQVDSVVSYGPCQFPTLGFIVSQWNRVKGFVSEPFWYIHLSLSRQVESSGAPEETTFIWRRGHIFDEEVALELYEEVCKDQPNTTARVTKVVQKETKKWKPLPLTTVELQKAASRLLRLAPKKALDIAEKLYQTGFLSYPRTETDQFDAQFDFMTLIDKQKVDPVWGAFATNLTDHGGFGRPRQGKNNDKAHPPIHPTAHAGNLAGDDKNVYDYITRRFLACCSKDAEGWQTTIDVECGGEEFYATGLVVTARNYLDVYPYDKWSGHVLPDFEEGEEFQPTECFLKDGNTTAPKLLTEADLVTLMDKNGIGTDATIAEHIAKVVERDYVIERMEGATKYLAPSTLGIGLVEGYNKIGFDKSLSKPQLRRETERSMVQICHGTKTKHDMLEESLHQYREMFVMAKRNFNQVITSVRQYVEGNGPAAAGRGRGLPRGGPPAGNGRGGPPDGGNGRGGPPGGNNRPRGPPPPRGGGPGNGPAPRRPPAPRRDPSSDSDIEITDERPPAARSRQIKPAAAPNRQQAMPPPPIPRRNAPTISEEEIQCQCPNPAVQRTVTKEGASKGRMFWTCADRENSCNFFAWAGNASGPVASDSSPPSRDIPTKRSYSKRQDSNDDNAPRMCHTCRIPAVSRTTHKEGPNKDRIFWTCPEKETANCNFFEWDDEPPRNGGATGNTYNNSEPRSQLKATKSQEGNCQQPGHWANACPQNGGPSKRPKSFSGDNETSDMAGGAECYICKEEGHFSSQCPQRTGGGKSSTGGRTPSRGSSRGSAKRGRSRGRGGTGSRGKRGAAKKSKFGAPDDF